MFRRLTAPSRARAPCAMTAVAPVVSARFCPAPRQDEHGHVIKAENDMYGTHTTRPRRMDRGDPTKKEDKKPNQVAYGIAGIAGVSAVVLLHYARVFVLNIGKPDAKPLESQNLPAKRESSERTLKERNASTLRGEDGSTAVSDTKAAA